LRQRPGSFRRAVEGLLLCRARGLATQINMVVTPSSHKELHAMALLASHLGCRALGLAHCKPTPDAVAAGLVMEPLERIHLETEIAALQSTFTLPILLAGDHYDPDPLALCPQLELRQLHVDHRGFLTACCELAGYRGGEPDSEVIADLATTPLHEAQRLLADRVAAVIGAKIEHLASHQLTPADLFICTRCMHLFGKALDTPQ
jgi:MoaA/NifB/PqqE/SkfB family radical SAM enzyme